MTPRSSSRPPARSWAAPAGPAPTTSRRPRPRRRARSRSGRRCRTPRGPRCCAGPATCSAEHAEELAGWNVREVGAIPGMAGFALHVAAEECYDAAACPSASLGELLPSEQPRLSMAKRVPVGVVGVISPFNVPLILSIRSVAPALALGNAVLLKPDPRTVVTGGVEHRPRLRGGRAAGRRAPAAARAAPTSARRSSTDPHVRVISFTGSTAGRSRGRRAGRPAPQARAPRAGRQLRDARARRRRRREGGQPRGVGIVLPPGPDLHDHRAAPRRTSASTTTSSRRSPRRPTTCPVGNPATERGRPRPGHRRGPARQDPRPGHGERPTPARRRPRWRRTTGCSTGRPCSPR